MVSVIVVNQKRYNSHYHGHYMRVFDQHIQPTIFRCMVFQKYDHQCDSSIFPIMPSGQLNDDDDNDGCDRPTTGGLPGQ